MSGLSGWGPLLGGLAGLGVLLCLSWLGARRPAPMLQRIAPYVSAPYAEVPLELSPSLWDALVAQVRLARLRVAPAPGSLTWLAVGASVGAALGLVLAAGGASVLLVAVLGVVGAVAGLWGCTQNRAHLARRWRQDVDAELPAVADLLSFSVTAGESLVAGIDRVAQTLRGPLAVELQRAGEQMRGGSSVEGALRSVSGGVASYERFVDAVVVALERGTPLADVLRAQADDVRSARRRTLLEMAGRKDVLMLVPVVFLILPTVVLIALFPAAQALRLLSS